MNVLSLFDGMSCGQIALERAGIKVDHYFASEIKKTAIGLVRKRYPQTIILGNVKHVHFVKDHFEIKNGDSWLEDSIKCNIDLLIGGSPCKGISRLNQNQEGLAHKESILFYDFLRLYKQTNPKYWLLENTPGNKIATNLITKEMKTRPIRLNSSLVSAQSRPRLYWTNIPVNSMPARKYLTTNDVFDDEMPDDLLISEGRIAWLNNESGKKSIEKGYTRINPFPKSGCITANGHIKWNCNYILRDGKYRYLSIKELERLQTLPEGYCNGLSYSDAYDLIGDGWTIDIIAHILKHIPLNPPSIHPKAIQEVNQQDNS